MDFDAFISYARAADREFAPILRRDLRRKLRRWWGASRLSIFLDRTSLEPGDSLPALLRGRIEASRHFVLLASSQSAASSYVADEVAYWLKLHGTQNLVIVLTEGEIEWQDGAFTAATTLPVALREHFAEVPLYLDLRHFRSQQTRTQDASAYQELLAGLVARLTGRTKEWVLGEERRHKRRVALIGLSGLALLSILSTVALRARAGRQLALLHARSDRLLQAAADCIAEDPERSVRLALEASSILASPRSLEMAAAGLEAWRPGKRVAVHVKGIKSFAFSPDGSELITASSDGTAAVLSWPELAIESRLRGHDQSLVASGLDPRGEHAFTLGVDRSACLWRVRDQKLVQRLPHAYGVAVPQLSFDSPTGLLRMSSAQGRSRCFDLSTGLEVENPGAERWTDPLASRSISSDGRYELLLSADGSCRLVDSLDAGQSASTLVPIPGVLDMEFRPGTHEFATCSGDEHVRFWRSAELDSPLESVVAEQSVVGLTFSPNGRWLAALPPALGNSDAPNQFAVLIYDCDQRRIHWTLKPRKSSLTMLKFDPRSESIVAATMKGELEVWPVDPLQLANSHGPRELLATERSELGMPAEDAP